RADPDRAPVDVDVAVGPARVVDVARDVAAKRRVAGPALVNVEDPDALARGVPRLPPPRLGLPHQLSLVLDDVRVFFDGMERIDAPARNRRTKTDHPRKLSHPEL